MKTDCEEREMPCAPVDKRLTEIWTCVKSKVSTHLFLWIIGGLAVVLIPVLSSMFAIQWSTHANVVKIKTTLEAAIPHQAQLHKLHEERLKALESKRKRK